MEPETKTMRLMPLVQWTGAAFNQGQLVTIYQDLTHWGRVTHVCVSNLNSVGSDNGLSPGRRQAIIWTNDGILLIGLLGTNFSEILVEIYIFSFKKMHLKLSGIVGHCQSALVTGTWFGQPIAHLVPSQIDDSIPIHQQWGTKEIIHIMEISMLIQYKYVILPV